MTHVHLTHLHQQTKHYKYRLQYVHCAYLYSMHFGSKSSCKHKNILMIRLTDRVRLPASLFYNKCDEYILRLDYVVHK